ncbi:hypothetical protein GUJ93_ZPchr0006g42004 [Zizania palustris]|uniref:Uncharacterized protein n=1 Tax=Zizania palustris TaxID=103762 RepID=A0A8J5SV23_ZIZPA|nr:hypothetical protein GUJ93_ZPchr0006g42004 [Zizania palustris]
MRRPAICPIHTLASLHRDISKCLNNGKLQSTESIELFIGAISSANHFAKCMAVWKSWIIATRTTSKVVGQL